METSTYKTCIKCKHTKLYSEFVVYGTSANGTKGYKNVCKQCSNKAATLREKLYKKHDKPEDNKCEICGCTSKKLVLDHCHITEKFRGWLCNHCNVALGRVHDDINILQNAINYLSKDND